MDIIRFIKSIFTPKTPVLLAKTDQSSRQNAHRAKMRHLYKRENRRIRHSRIWTVLNFMRAYTELVQCDDFYSFKNMTIRFNQAMGLMKKEHIQRSEIDVAIRFCRMEHHNGICQYNMCPSEIDRLHQWNNIIIDNHTILKETLCSYKQYWDSVLYSYIKLSAKKNRLKYLINDLDKIMTLPELQAYPDIINDLNSFQKDYSSQLNSL